MAIGCRDIRAKCRLVECQDNFLQVVMKWKKTKNTRKKKLQIDKNYAKGSESFSATFPLTTWWTQKKMHAENVQNNDQRNWVIRNSYLELVFPFIFTCLLSRVCRFFIGILFVFTLFAHKMRQNSKFLLTLIILFTLLKTKRKKKLYRGKVSKAFIHTAYIHAK